MELLADTNVLLRFADRSDPRHTIVRHAVRKLRHAGHTLRAAEQNYVEFWNVATRPREQNGAGLEPEDAEQQLRLIERLFPRLPHSDLYAEWRSLVSAFRVRRVKVHDTRLVAAMNANAITHIVTFNADDFQRYADRGIVAVDPGDVDALIGDTA